MNQEDCKICYQIKCKKCGWIASDEEVALIQEQKLTTCPKCGWNPSDKLT